MYGAPVKLAQHTVKIPQGQFSIEQQIELYFTHEFARKIKSSDFFFDFLIVLSL